MTSGPWIVNSSVYPSGGACATAAVPTLPPAPGRLSITIGWPSVRPSGSATTRAMMSGELPGGNGTTSLIARAGQACAADGSAIAEAVAAMEFRTERRCMVRAFVG